MVLRPTNGGFQRKIRTAQFIIDSLKGLGPEESRRFAPEIGACMVDVFAEYKDALLRLAARDAVDIEGEKQNQTRSAGVYRRRVHHTIELLSEAHSPQVLQNEVCFLYQILRPFEAAGLGGINW